MAAILPVYEVEFIPLERRLSERRIVPEAQSAKGINVDRRAETGRRKDDKPRKTLKVIR